MNMNDKGYWMSIILTAIIFIIDSVFNDHQSKLWEMMALMLLFNLLFKGENVK
jgi:hypothetical protein